MSKNKEAPPIRNFRNMNYVLIFLGLNNSLLDKDVGMIPYYFKKLLNTQSKILTYKNPNLNESSNGLELKFMEKKGYFFQGLNLHCEKSVIKYLLKNAKNIDFLILFHLTEENIRYGVLYKLLNKKGFLHLKLDSTIKILKNKEFYFKEKKEYKDLLDYINYKFIRILRKRFFNKVDLISAETKGLTSFLKDKYPHLRKKIIFLPNGVNDLFINEIKFNKISYKEKENIILTVGRIGAYQKSSETLLEAIKKIKDLNDWKVIFVGPINEDFKKYINKYFKENPELHEKIIFTGRILDREKLFNFYKRSKIFCLTSRWESFGIVLVEAAYFGNYLVCTNILSAREITEDGNNGELFEIGDSDALAEILENLITNEYKIKENFQKIYPYAQNKYSWSQIIKELVLNISKRKELS